MIAKPRRIAGFTLIELMIVLAVIAILATLAYPSYLGYVQRARRADGQVALQRVMVAQEKWRTGHSSYASALSDLGLETSSEAGRYSLSLSAVTATGFRAVATAIGEQANDTACSPMTLTLRSGGALDLASGASTTDDVNGCWKK